MDYQAGTILTFDKPLGWTSFSLVGKIRYLLCQHMGIKKLKVGHAGTLDPLATGVLVVCTGKATKKIDALQTHTKEYVATLQLGSTTPSFDLETEIDGRYPTEHITRELIKNTIKQFQGTIEQVPPAFSACKVDGHRAYKLARRGEGVDLKAKTLVIDEIKLIDFNQETMRAKICVTCSKGTYIRALARDIGRALKSGAHLTDLRRTRVGNYRVEDCLRVDEFPIWLEKHPHENINETSITTIDK